MTFRSDQLRQRIVQASWRDLLVVGVPLLLILILGFWGASRFIRPAPPDTLVLASGDDGGAYQRFAASYADVLGRYGVKLVEQPSGGSIENLARLRKGDAGVDAGFFQGGTGEPLAGDTLYSLGAFYYEPLWIFFRESQASRHAEPDRIQALKGKRIAIGVPGSGSHHLGLALLQASGIDTPNTTLLPQGGLELADLFAKNAIDAAIVVGPTQSATVWSLLFTPGVRPMNLVHADAYTRRMPYLSKIVLPRGAVDIGRDIPRHDVTMLASTATLLVREDIHPALINLLMQAASEVHGMPGIFQKPGEFPKASAVDFPLSSESERYFKSGKPFLQRYLPFWAATLIDRLVVMLIPVFALLLPIVKFAPLLYGWRVRSRIYRRYGELKFLEAELAAEPASRSRTEWLARLDAIEDDVNRIPTPLAFSDKLYTLRSHIALVRKAMANRTATSA